MSKDWFNDIKSKFKQHPRIYGLLIDYVSPVYVDRRKDFRFIYKYVKKDAQTVVINLGSGPFSLDAGITNVDFCRYPNIHIVSDIQKLPFKDHSVDCIINVAVLEHIRSPHAVIAEAHRVLKSGGYIYSVVPFIVGFHAAPEDYNRFTKEGVINLHDRFKCVEIGVYGGPTSGFLWILEEWLAILLSFGSMTLYKILYLFFMGVLWPVKFLDILLSRYSTASSITSTFYYIGKKE